MTKPTCSTCIYWGGYEENSCRYNPVYEPHRTSDHWCGKYTNAATMINWIKGPPEWAEERRVLVWMDNSIYYIRARSSPYTGAKYWLPWCDSEKEWPDNDPDIKYHAFINEPEGV